MEGNAMTRKIHKIREAAKKFVADKNTDKVFTVFVTQLPDETCLFEDAAFMFKHEGKTVSVYNGEGGDDTPSSGSASVKEFIDMIEDNFEALIKSGHNTAKEVASSLDYIILSKDKSPYYQCWVESVVDNFIEENTLKGR